jgi:serine/threonine-protein kinase
VATTRDSQAGPSQLPFGPFLLERRIAVGGSAEVFLARPKIGVVPAARLVVKRLLPASREGSEFDVLEREAELHQAVRHPNVVKVFGAGMVGDEPYLAMEYVEGVDLYRLLRRAEADSRRMPPALAVYVARRVADALIAVHDARDRHGAPLSIVHRDVTPSNIYLSIEGAVKLGDFGIARVLQLSKQAKPTAGLKGKFGYLSPEQVAGEPFDHRADLFALTVLLGEMLIGERIFPGSGQLAVLLAIRDVNIEPLRRKAHELPSGLFELCVQGLAREPAARFASAAELSAALARFEQPSGSELARTLSEWVRWARDSSQLAARIEGQIRDSVERMRAVRKLTPMTPSPMIEIGAGDAEPASGSLSRVRCADGRVFDGVNFPRLIEMIATGDLLGDDEVSVMGAGFRKIGDIEALARHLLPSTSATTGRLFEPGAPDYQVDLRETPMHEVLARLRQKAETGALFVERRDQTAAPQRKEIYLAGGRLLHVASSDRAELLGEYLVRRGALERADLERALGMLERFGGRLGDTLVGLGIVDAVHVFRAIRDQGRDRVAALCGWPRGRVAFYRGTGPGHVEFPLDLDLASPMMAGAIIKSRGDPRSLLPANETRLRPGPRLEAVADRAERGTAPMSLQLVPALCEEGADVAGAIAKMTRQTSSGQSRPIGEKEACAALVTAKHLGWILI